MKVDVLQRGLCFYVCPESAFPVPLISVKVDPPLQSVMNFMEKECTIEGGVRDDKAH